MALEKLKYRLFAVLFFLFLGHCTWGETITDIQIQGLKRTKPYILMERLEKFKGIDSAKFDNKKLEAELQKTQLFSSIKASVAGSVIQVAVEEKLALLPIPYAYASSDSWSGGLVVMDSNAFGIMDQAAVGGFLSSSGWNAMASYSHIQRRQAPFGWNLSAYGGKSKSSVRDEDGYLLLSYENQTFGASAGLNKRLSPWLRGSISTGINICDVEENRPSSEFIIPFTASITASTSKWNGTFLDSIYLTTSATYSCSVWHDNYCTLAVKAGWEQHLVQRLRLIAQAGAYYSPDVPVVFAKNQGAAQVSLFSGGCRATSMAGAGAGLEWGITQTRLGVPSLYAQYQVLWANTVFSGETWGHGPLVGFKFYLQKVAFPAVDIFSSYNVKTGHLRTSAGAGFSY